MPIKTISKLCQFQHLQKNYVCPGHGSGLCKKNICVYNFCRALGVGVCE